MKLFVRFVALVVSFVCAFELSAQVPKFIFGPSPTVGASNLPKSLACADQDAGIATQSLDATSQSNDVTFLCFNDILNIDHDQSGNLTGDPEPITAPGFGYGFYSCPPIVSGPDLASIVADACILGDPDAPTGIYVTTGIDPGGDAQFTNNGFLQNFFENGNPVQIFFAALTLDDFDTNGFEQLNGGPVGPCVNVSITDAFPVVYLNEITATNVNYQTGILGGNFIVGGGLPEYTPTSNYTISIVNVNNPGVIGTVTSGNATDGSVVTYTVPSIGKYTVTVEDGKSCSSSFIVSLPAVSVSLSDETTTSGNSACVELSVVNFTDISDFSLSIEYDISLLDYTGPATFNLTGFDAADITETVPGVIDIDWSSTGLGITVGNNTNIVQLCFNAVGANGTLAPLGYVDTPLFNNPSGPAGVISQSGSVTISAGGFALSINTDSVSCGETPALSDGSFTIVAVGGSAPYGYTWQSSTGGLGGSGTIPISGGGSQVGNLPVGTYSITVTTAFGQQQITSAVIGGASPIFVSLTATNPSCSNTSNGSINISSLGGGVGPYNIEWNIAGFEDVLTLPNLAQGNYIATITDARLCTRVASSSIGVNPILITGSDVTEATCLGINNGSVAVLGVSGGTPTTSGAYTFTWSNSTTSVGTSATLLNLAPGTYTVTITDSNLCTNSAAFVVSPDLILTINATLTDLNCFEQPTGVITAAGITVGAVPATPYIFDWSANVGSPIINPTSTLASGLAADVYTLNITDQNGCMADTIFTLTEPPLLEIVTVASTNETCTLGNDGTASVVLVTGGVSANGQYQYSWFNGTTPAIINLSAGTYTVTVSDDNSCIQTSVFTILPPQPPVITGFDAEAPSCSNVNDGVVSVLVDGGAATITNYQWLSSGGPVLQSGATLTGLSAATYTVTVTDAAGCTVSSSVLVVAPAAFALADTILDLPSCPGLSNGTIVLDVTGGTPDLIYSQVGGPDQGLNAFTGLAAGTYNFEVTDANNCPFLAITIVLPDPPALSVLFTGIDSVSCANQLTGCNGSATATASGGSANTGAFNFLWSSGESAVGVNSAANELCSGDQTVTVNDGICTSIFTVNIPSPPVINATGVATPATCFGDCDGTISVVPTGGTPPYLITWSTGLPGNPQTNLCAGDYNALIIDSKGCNFVLNADVEQPDTLIAIIDSDNSNGMSCFNVQDGLATVLFGGGNATLGNYTFSWFPPVGSTESVANLNVGTYIVTVTDPLGCLDTARYTVTRPEPILAVVPAPELPLCFGFQTTVTVDTAFGGNGGPYLFRVDFGPEYELGDVAPIYAGDHTVSVVDLGLGKECVLDTVIFVTEPPAITVDLGPDMEIELGAAFTFDPIIESALPLDFDSIFWTPPSYLSFDNDPRRPTTNPLAPITYTLTVFDINGCVGSNDIFIDVDRNRNVFIPNIFSPNGDDINDLLSINMGIGVSRATFFRVFDRWGNKIYEAENVPPGSFKVGWDGYYRGNLMAPAVYTYIAEVAFIDGVKLLFKGDVTLMR